KDATFSDVTICFGDRQFYAHKVILASRSEYFKSMFTNAFKESNQRTITLEDDDPEALEIMLNWMY
ncbi:BTB/POZ protein, partial [Elsinoe ampelina]